MISNCELLTGKVCLVTGASRGIGCAIAAKFAACGAVVYANGRKEESLKGLLSPKEDCTGSVIPLYFDVTDSAAARKAMMQIKKEQGKLDVLVNNAGIMKDALIGMISKEEMQQVFEVNVFAVMEMLQLAVKLMSRQNSGSIINLASIVGTNGNRGQMVYSASKGAVILLTKTAAKELVSKDIK